MSQYRPAQNSGLLSLIESPGPESQTGEAKPHNDWLAFAVVIILVVVVL